MYVQVLRLTPDVMNGQQRGYKLLATLFTSPLANMPLQRNFPIPEQW